MKNLPTYESFKNNLIEGKETFGKFKKWAKGNYDWKIKAVKNAENAIKKIESELGSNIEDYVFVERGNSHWILLKLKEYDSFRHNRQYDELISKVPEIDLRGHGDDGYPDYQINYRIKE